VEGRNYFFKIIFLEVLGGSTSLVIISNHNQQSKNSQDKKKKKIIFLLWAIKKYGRKFGHSEHRVNAEVEKSMSIFTVTSFINP
jgi:hypothetical protein